MNLAIIFGGTSSEREVSINTGGSVLNALKSQNNISSIDFPSKFVPSIAALSLVVYPL